MEYNNKNFLKMETGTIVKDVLSLKWEVLSNDGKEVVLKNIPSNPALRDKGVRMTLREGEFNNSFSLLEKVS